MKINQEQLLNSTPDDAARLLYEAGSTLRGMNLKKSSWLLIANGLHVHRISDILLQRLEAAQTRQDALRVLRIARKWVRTRKQAKGAQHRTVQENPQAIAAEMDPQWFMFDEEDWQYEMMLDEETWPRANYEEWLLANNSANASRRARLPGVRAASTLQDLIDRYAWERRSDEPYLSENLRGRVDDETYIGLLALTRQKPGLGLTEGELAFLHRHKLQLLLDYLENPFQAPQPVLIEDGATLAGLRMIEDHVGPKGHAFQVNWEAIRTWLVDYLVRPPQVETVHAVIASAYAFFRGAPAFLLADLMGQAKTWQPEWLSLIWYAGQRAPELFSDRPVKRLHGNVVDWMEAGAAYVHDIYWERILDAGIGSKLVLHQLKSSMTDLFGHPAAIHDRYKNSARRLLLGGGGTLRRMAYPAFTLTCRPSISLVRLDTFTELTKLAWALVRLDHQMSGLDRSSLAEWIKAQFRDLSSEQLTEGIGEQVAEELEQHAIAYLMLKDRVLHNEFQAAPFRLRRKHIQRFWEGQASGKTAYAAPKNLGELRIEFGTEPVKEALVHALFDHFKDDWEVPAASSFLLKETLLLLLRSIAITYHLRAPWLPPMGGQLAEYMLQHTQEVANFLIQQTEHAPVELAQALLLAPGQGLPLLSGGRVTPLERNCRHLVRVIAGVSQKKVSDGEARLFTCQPISKIEALDRGNLGGDCSSGSVPLRALSPHHTYYGIFENGKQQRGYMTLYEAWAELENETGAKERLPVLCLETINVPMRIFDAVQQDLLVIFEAIAKSRGLVEGLVLITGILTWNYQNGEVLRQSRRFRQGLPVRLFPADPVDWNLYTLLSNEAEYYTAFIEDAYARHFSDNFRLLAPFDASLDVIEPENLAEAQRIAALPPKKLVITARWEDGPAGFISELPQII